MLGILQKPRDKRNVPILLMLIMMATMMIKDFVFILSIKLNINVKMMIKILLTISKLIYLVVIPL